MSKIIIYTPNAPEPIGPYSQAVLTGNPDIEGQAMLFISGQICIDPATGGLKNKDIQEETNQVMKNLKAILEAAKMDFSNVVKTTIYLTDMRYFDDVNSVYGKYFETDIQVRQFPARETVQVPGLPKIVNVEISMIAVN